MTGYWERRWIPTSVARTATEYQWVWFYISY